jgi:hypothetical protein
MTNCRSSYLEINMFVLCKAYDPADDDVVDHERGGESVNDGGHERGGESSN